MKDAVGVGTARAVDEVVAGAGVGSVAMDWEAAAMETVAVVSAVGGRGRAATAAAATAGSVAWPEGTCSPVPWVVKMVVGRGKEREVRAMVVVARAQVGVAKAVVVVASAWVVRAKAATLAAAATQAVVAALVMVVEKARHGSAHLGAAVLRKCPGFLV